VQRLISWRLSFDERKSLHFLANSEMHKEVRRNQRWIADYVSDDARQWWVKLADWDRSWAVWSQSLVSATE